MQGESVSGARDGRGREGGLLKGTSEKGMDRGMDGARERGDGGSGRRRE